MSDSSSENDGKGSEDETCIKESDHDKIVNESRSYEKSVSDGKYDEIECSYEGRNDFKWNTKLVDHGQSTNKSFKMRKLLMMLQWEVVVR